MKYPKQLLLASAAILLTSIAGQCLASQVIIPIPAGTTIGNGVKPIKLTGTSAIANAPIYYYAVSGTVVGNGDFAGLTGTSGTGVSIATILPEITGSAPAAIAILSGTVVDLSSKFPFVALNKLAKGSFTFSPSTTGTTGSSSGTSVTVTGQLKAKAGIVKSGIPYFDLSNISFVVKVPHLGSRKLPTSDTLAFTGSGGQILVSTTPIVSGTVQPDLAFTGTAGSLVGVGVIGTTGTNETASIVLTKGKVANLNVILINSGSASDTFTLKATAPAAGFTQKFIYKGKNVTSLVAISGTAVTSGSSTAVAFPFGKKDAAEPLASGGAIALTWQIKATTSGSTSGLLTATSTTGTTGTNASDTIGFSVTK
jgi:hypothetical protein